MQEATKSKRIWSDLEWSVLKGEGIDIGCGDDPVLPGVRPFDVIHGDANTISGYVDERYDFVYSSHCLEHMHDPRLAIMEWWKLVKPGGHLFFIVPDEDLFEQGIFPSVYNPDHKATFTIKKNKSWSPVSFNVLDLIKLLPDSELVNVELQDNNYKRNLLRHGSFLKKIPLIYPVISKLHKALHKKNPALAYWLRKKIYRFGKVSQTRKADRLAQIQCIVRKLK